MDRVRASKAYRELEDEALAEQAVRFSQALRAEAVNRDPIPDTYGSPQRLWIANRLLRVADLLERACFWVEDLAWRILI